MRSTETGPGDGDRVGLAALRDRGEHGLLRRLALTQEHRDPPAPLTIHKPDAARSIRGGHGGDDLVDDVGDPGLDLIAILERHQLSKHHDSFRRNGSPQPPPKPFR